MSKSKKALFKNLLQELIKHGKIKTTQGRARVLQGQVDRVVNRAKVKGTSERYLLSLLPQKLMEKLVGEIAPKFVEGKSGFTRVTKLGKRAGDNAPMVLVEWVEGKEITREEPVKEKSKVVKKVKSKAENKK